MLSEEEKIAIEILQEVASDDFDTLGDDISPKMAQNILNVINKQQKEIEEKSTIIMAGAEKVKQLEKEIEDLKEKNRHLEIDKSQLKAYIETCCINKTKIEKKIYELEEQMQQDEVDEFGIHSIGWRILDYVVEQLKELLEEK